jgi:2-(3-amino-3-carboxypropyl)histidine synthase
MTASQLFNQLDADYLRSTVRGHHRVLLKIPDGLLSHATDIADLLANEGVDVIISANSCYGSCDIGDNLTGLGVDLILFVGEAAMPSLQDYHSIPTANVIIKSSNNIEDVLDQAIPLLEGTTIGLVSIAPYLHHLEKAMAILKNNNMTPLVGKSGRRTVVDGQILGCDFSAGTVLADQVDSYLYIGDGLFHPLGMAMATKKPVVAADPSLKRVIKQELSEMKNSLLKQRYATIARAMDAQRVGIIIGTKLGQSRIQLGQQVKAHAEKKGFAAYCVAANNLQPDRLDYLDVDCYISTACPRLVLDDSSRFAKPLLTPAEFEILIGERTWDDYELDQIF